MIGGSDSNRSEKQGPKPRGARPKEAISKDTIAGTRTGSEALPRLLEGEFFTLWGVAEVLLGRKSIGGYFWPRDVLNLCSRLDASCHGPYPWDHGGQISESRAQASGAETGKGGCR